VPSQKDEAELFGKMAHSQVPQQNKLLHIVSMGNQSPLLGIQGIDNNIGSQLMKNLILSLRKYPIFSYTNYQSNYVAECLFSSDYSFLSVGSTHPKSIRQEVQCSLFPYDNQL
jgi:hypothetical protein